MKRIFLITAVLFFLYEGSPLLAQQMKWTVLAPNILQTVQNGASAYGAMAAKDSVVFAGWVNLVLSTDLGKTWKQLSVPQPLSTVHHVDVFDRHTLVYASNTGTYYSSDQGASWIQVWGLTTRGVLFDGAPNVLLLDDFSDSLYRITVGGSVELLGVFSSQINSTAIAADGTYRVLHRPDYNTSVLESSVPGGTTWIRGNTIPALDSQGLIPDQDDPNRLTIVNENWNYRVNDSSNLWLTTDNGKSWLHTLGKPLGNPSYLTGNSSTGCHDYFAGTDPEGVLRSSDKGLTWASIGGPATPVDSYTLAAYDDSLIFLVDQFGSIWSTDPVTHNGPFSAHTPLFETSTIPLCDSPLVEIVTLSQNSCFSRKVISGIEIQGQDPSSYQLQDSLLSASINYDTLWVRFLPTAVGPKHGALVVTYADGTSDSLQLGGSVTAPSSISLENVSSVVSDTIGGNATVSLTLRSTGVSSPIEFTIHYDTASLIYRGTFDNTHSDHTTSHPTATTARVSFDDVSDSEITILFSFYPVDSTCTTVSIDSITIANGLSQCFNILSNSVSTKLCMNACGIQTLARFVRYNEEPHLLISPNPSMGKITISTEEELDDADIVITDEFGRMQKVIHGATLSSVGYELDTDELSSGVYQVSVSTSTTRAEARFILIR